MNIKSKKTITILLVLACILTLSAFLVCKNIFMSSRNNARFSAEILKKIVNREIIEDTYFNYISDKEIVAKMEEYNSLTAKYKAQYAQEATDYVSYWYNRYLLGVTPYLEKSEEEKNLIKRMTTYCMYQNAGALILGDREMPLFMDGGGAEWLTPWYFHGQGGFYTKRVPDNKAEFDEYSALANGLAVKLYSKLPAVEKQYFIGKIQEKILNRQMVEDAYFNFLPPSLGEKVDKYNMFTWRGYYGLAGQAYDIVAPFLTSKGYVFPEAEYYYQKWADIGKLVIPKLALLPLYKNGRQMVNDDTDLSILLAPVIDSFFHDPYYQAGGFSDGFNDRWYTLEEYFAFIDEIIQECDDIS